MLRDQDELSAASARRFDGERRQPCDWSLFLSRTRAVGCLEDQEFLPDLLPLLAIGCIEPLCGGGGGAGGWPFFAPVCPLPPRFCCPEALPPCVGGAAGGGACFEPV